MENIDANFKVSITVKEDFLLVSADGNYSFQNGIYLLEQAVDNAVSANRSRILINVDSVTGSIPFIERFEYAEFLADYLTRHALGKITRISLVGKEPIIDKGRLGETVARNRGINIKVTTEMPEALNWLLK